MPRFKAKSDGRLHKRQYTVVVYYTEWSEELKRITSSGEWFGGGCCTEGFRDESFFFKSEAIAQAVAKRLQKSATVAWIEVYPEGEPLKKQIFKGSLMTPSLSKRITQGKRLRWLGRGGVSPKSTATARRLAKRPQLLHKLPSKAARCQSAYEAGFAKGIEGRPPRPRRDDDKRAYKAGYNAGFSAWERLDEEGRRIHGGRRRRTVARSRRSIRSGWRKGAMHRALGVAKGKRIPTEKLIAAFRRGGVTAKRARFLLNLRGVKTSEL